MRGKVADPEITARQAVAAGTVIAPRAAAVIPPAASGQEVIYVRLAAVKAGRAGTAAHPGGG